MKKTISKQKIININGLKFYSFDDILKKELKSKSFRASYNEEMARLKMARQIREFRTAKKLTQNALAKKADMPQSVIARIESGNHSISLDTLNRIAHAIGRKVELV